MKNLSILITCAINLPIALGKLRLYALSQQQNSQSESSFLQSSGGCKPLLGLSGGTLKMEQSIINGASGRKAMFEKLLLAVTITFSLNFFFQVHLPEQNNSGVSYVLQPEQSATIVVTKSPK
ncbi:MAG: hypothetical protein PUP90_27970 [Nostoc sp. S4]|nr:hypothetical protein [Nostoc sp. S4]